jgi:starvation-inducible DNA-binding protein
MIRKTNYNLIFFSILSTVLLMTSVTTIKTMMGETTMPFLDIDPKIAKKHADLLNKLLANEYVLYTKTLNFHWNVKGKLFGELHKLFETQYEQLLAIVDVVAEQIKMLGFHTIASLQEFMKLKTISEEPFMVTDDTEMLKTLTALHQEVIKQIRSILTEMASSNNYALENILQEILAKHEKTHWMLKSHLE